MSVVSAVRGIFAKVSSMIEASRRLSDFTCADCDRSDRCGMPSSDTCVFRAEQIARGDWKAKRPGQGFFENVLRL